MLRQSHETGSQYRDQSRPVRPNKDLIWRRLNWNLMRLFHEIVEHGGITNAARSLGRQQPATSQALSRLEQELGVALCRRGPAGFSVTPQGEIVFRAAAAMVDVMRQASMALSQADGLVQGQLHVAIIADLVNHDFDEVLATVLRRHSLMDVALNSAPWQDVLNAVRSGEADIGLCYTHTHDPMLVYDSAFDETQQLYCGALHPLYGTTFENPGLLKEQSFFLLGAAEPVELSSFRRRFGLGTRVRGESESIAELKRLILTGTGIGFLPSHAIEDGGQSDNLWPLLRDTALPTCSLHLVTRPQAANAILVRTFLDEARAHLQAKKPASMLNGMA
jgi:DNA-binding transcriptional LysR family regulator